MLVSKQHIWLFFHAFFDYRPLDGSVFIVKQIIKHRTSPSASVPAVHTVLARNYAKRVQAIDKMFTGIPSHVAKRGGQSAN